MNARTDAPLWWRRRSGRGRTRTPPPPRPRQRCTGARTAPAAPRAPPDGRGSTRSARTSGSPAPPRGRPRALSGAAACPAAPAAARKNCAATCPRRGARRDQAPEKHEAAENGGWGGREEAQERGCHFSGAGNQQVERATLPSRPLRPLQPLQPAPAPNSRLLGALRGTFASVPDDTSREDAALPNQDFRRGPTPNRDARRGRHGPFAPPQPPRGARSAAHAAIAARWTSITPTTNAPPVALLAHHPHDQTSSGLAAPASWASNGGGGGDAGHPVRRDGRRAEGDPTASSIPRYPTPTSIPAGPVRALSAPRPGSESNLPRDGHPSRARGSTRILVRWSTRRGRQHGCLTAAPTLGPSVLLAPLTSSATRPGTLARLPALSSRGEPYYSNRSRADPHHALRTA